MSNNSEPQEPICLPFSLSFFTSSISRFVNYLASTFTDGEREYGGLSGKFSWGADLEVAGIISSCLPLARPEVTWTQLTKEEAGKCNQTICVLSPKGQWIWWAQSVFCLSICFFPPHLQNVFSSVQSFSHVRLCDPMNHSTPGLPGHHQLPEFTQTHVHRVSDAIQPSHLLLSHSSPAPNLSQHQSLFQLVSSSREVSKVLEFQL